MGTQYGDEDHLNDQFDAWKKRRAEADAKAENAEEGEERKSGKEEARAEELRRKYLKRV